MPIHWFWILALLVVVLIIFGPGRLPELGGAVGRAMREFRKATTEMTDEMKKSVETAPTANATSTTTETPPTKADTPKS
jgi:sec-independent protein translocase protein TatA